MLASYFLAAVALASPAPLELPAGWRYPNAGELADPERADSPDKYTRVVADFNGDGFDDAALLLKHRARSADALWISLSDGKGGRRWIQYDELPWGPDNPDAPLAMGIEKMGPGVIAYGCYEDSECHFGPESERPKLKLKSPGLVYFRFGSAASLLFWSNRHERFLRVWLSD